MSEEFYCAVLRQCTAVSYVLRIRSDMGAAINAALSSIDPSMSVLLKQLLKNDVVLGQKVESVDSAADCTQMQCIRCV